MLITAVGVPAILTLETGELQGRLHIMFAEGVMQSYPWEKTHG